MRILSVGLVRASDDSCNNAQNQLGLGLSPLEHRRSDCLLHDLFRLPAAVGHSCNTTVEPGWLLIARSGQVYGLNGSVAFATKAHVGRVLSDHLIRVAPGPNTTIRTGYAFVALSHPVLGRPLVKSLLYGSSIPQLDVSDVQEFAIPRLPKGDENVIGELADRAAACWGEADVLEQRMGERCDRAIEALLHPPAGSRKHRRSAPR